MKSYSVYVPRRELALGRLRLWWVRMRLVHPALWEARELWRRLFGHGRR